VSLSKHLSLISIIDSSSVRLGVIPSAFAWVIASSGTWGSLWLWISCCSWWLPPPRRLGAVDEHWHELVNVHGHLLMIVRGLIPSPAERQKVTLVDCSCHWVTSLVGRFLRCQVLARCVIPITRRTTKCWSTQLGLARRQAHESREKNWFSCALDFSRWLNWYSWFVHLPYHGGIIILHTLLYLPCLHSCPVKLFSVVSLWELFSLVSEAL
jgi:hypothetical protein